MEKICEQLTETVSFPYPLKCIIGMELLMKQLILLSFLFSAACAVAQPFGNLWNHVYWQAGGNYFNESFGIDGLDTIGRINDTIPDALAIGADADSGTIYQMSYILNRTPLDSLHPDTMRQYSFPGNKVIRGNINGDPYPDFVVYDQNPHGFDGHRIITILFGTSKIDSFTTALVINGTATDPLDYASIAVADVDLDGYDDIIIGDQTGNHDSTGAHEAGQIFYYKGGTKLDSTPTEILKGKFVNKAYVVGGQILVGRIHNKTQSYLIDARGHSEDSSLKIGTEEFCLYPFSRSFHLVPSETLHLAIDTPRSTWISAYDAVADIDGDSVDDIIIPGGDTVSTSYYVAGITMFVYKGGEPVDTLPSYYFHLPFDTHSSSFGAKIVDAGNMTGRGYHTLAISDPDAIAGGFGNGAVFLYNIGKALKDSCVAYASGTSGFGDALGTQMVPLSIHNAKGNTGIVVGAYDATTSGRVVAFWGDSSYGAPVSVKENNTPPNVFSLSQNYPNPFSGSTDISFVIHASRLYGAEVTVNLYNALGEKVETMYRGVADNYEYTVRVNAGALPVGNYYYRLTCGGQEMTKMMSVVK